MTAEQHNKYVALAHLANASLYLLMMGLMIVMFIAMIATVPDGRGGAPPIGFLVVMSVFMAAMTLIFTLPSLLAAYGFWKRKSWAKTAGIVGAVMAAMNFPVGVAACVYTFWFLFSDPGKAMYDKPRYSLPPPPPAWAPAAANQARDYAARTPPDWR